MAVLVACPKCTTRLKLAGLPTQSTKVQCPKCAVYFMVAAPKSTGVTATPPAPAKTAPARREPAASFTPPRLKSASASGKGKWIAVAAAVLALGGAGTGAFFLTRGEPTTPTSPDTQVATKSDLDKTPDKTLTADNTNPPAKTEKPKEKKHHGRDQKYVDFTRHMVNAGKDAQAGRYDNAIDDYNDALKIFPEDKDAIQGKADAQAALAALALAKKADDKDKSNLTEIIKSGNEALGKRQYSTALEYFKIAVQKAPTDADAKGGLTTATEALARSADEQKKLAEQVAADQKKLDDFNSYIESGNALLKVSNFADAYQKALLAQAIAPNNPDAMQKASDLRAQAEQGLAGLKDQDARMKQFTQLMAQGGAALTNKRADEAEQVYKQALALYPDDMNAAKGVSDAQALGMQLKTQFQLLMNQGNQALANNDFANAVNFFLQATMLFPNDATASTALNNAQQALNQFNLYTQAIARATAAMMITNYPAAISAYSDALAAVPNDPTAQQGLLNAQNLLAQYLIARAQFDAYVAQAIPLLQLQKNADALALLNMAIKTLPTNPNIVYTQALANYATGMTQGPAATNAMRYGDAVNAYTNAVNAVGPLAAPPVNDPLALQLLPNAQGAQANAQQTLQTATQNFNNNYLQGGTFLQQAKYPNASTSFANAINAYPFHANANMARTLKTYADAMVQGQTAVTAKNYAAAIQAYNSALAAVPNDPPATQALAQAQQANAAAGQAAANYTAMVQQANQLKAQKMYADSLKLLNQAMKLTADNTQLAMLQTQINYMDAMAKAQSAAAAKNYDAAAAAYQKALAAVPADAVAQQELQNLQQAQQAAALTRKDFESKVEQARALLKQQKYAEASQMFSTAIGTLQPKDPQAAGLQQQIVYADNMAKGQASLNAKNYKDAMAAFNTALAASPNDATAKNGVAQAQQALQSAALANQSKDFDNKVQQGDALLGQKNYAQAALFFNEALKSMPKNPNAAGVANQAHFAGAMAKATAAMTAKNYAAAVAAYNDAVKTNAADPTAQQGLQNAQQALNGANQANQAKTFDTNVQQGHAKLNQREYAQAAKHYNDAVKAMPGNAQVATTQKQAQFADAMHRAHSAVTAKNLAGAAGAFAEASQAANDAVKQNANNPQNATLSTQGRYADAMSKGYTALNARNFANAAAQFQAALTAIPNDHTATTALAQARKQK